MTSWKRKRVKRRRRSRRRRRRRRRRWRRVRSVEGGESHLGYGGVGHLLGADPVGRPDDHQVGCQDVPAEGDEDEDEDEGVMS